MSKQIFFALKSCRLVRTIIPVFLLTLGVPIAQAQVTNVLFFEDFESGIIDTNELVPDAPFFEGGIGDIAATVVGGELEFAGTVSQQWWAGATLRLVPTFTVSDANQVAVEVDRVAELGAGTASRSALWILDSTQTRYVLFADVRGEGGWHYNRKIGEATGDSPTGGGVNMAALDQFDEEGGGGLHVMRAVANGKTVKLYVDDVFGAEVKFPFTDILFHVGSYARATDDTAFTHFDNLKVYSIGANTFGVVSQTLTLGETGGNIAVRIPEGANATAPVVLRIVSSNPTIAKPTGAADSTLTLTFAAGTTNVQTISATAGTQTGGAQFTIENDLGIAAGNILNVTVIEGAGLRLEDTFTGTTLDAAKWEINPQGFEPAGDGFYEVVQGDGQLTISGTGTADFWGGNSIRSLQSFTATKDLPLVVELDRVSISRMRLDETESTAARTGLWLTTSNRSQYVFFSQNLGEGGWQVNLTTTGGGTPLTPFASLATDTNLHRMKLVADGEGVDVYLDNQWGGRFDFEVSAGLQVEIGAYSRAFDDSVHGVFDNLKVENALPCIHSTPASILTTLGQSGNTVTVTIPRLLNLSAAAAVTITSQSPAVAVPQGGTGGSLTLNFAAGATNVQTFDIQTVGLGTAVFGFTSAQSNCIDGTLTVAVTAVPQVLYSDTFSSDTISNAWRVDPLPLLETGFATADSAIIASNGAARITVISEITGWPGLALMTEETYEASATEPAIFEIDRTKLDFTLVTGTAAKQRTGVWVTDIDRLNYVFFSEYATHDGTAGGWQYHRSIGDATTDSPVTGAGVAITAFSAAQYNDRGDHRIKAVANGSTVKLYLDGQLGAEVSFPFSEGIVFGFGAYVDAGTDVVFGTFDNVVISGGSGPSSETRLSSVKEADGDVVITWTGPGTLESTEALGTAWTAVTPPPSGNTLTISPGSQGTHRFYRVRQ